MTSLDPKLMGPLAAIGIMKGNPFAPDARMKKIMTEALAVANATSRSLLLNARDPSWYLVMRLCWPKDTPPSVLPAGEGTWKPPGVVAAT